MGTVDDWKRWAEKGLFAYDYRDIHRTNKLEQYDCIAIPEKPLLAKDASVLKDFEKMIPRFDLAFGENITFHQMKNAEQ
jgi:hypothetical protein